MVMGGAEASVSGTLISGGAEGRRASSLSARADLLMLNRELVFLVRRGGPPASVIPGGVEDSRENGGGG